MATVTPTDSVGAGSGLKRTRKVFGGFVAKMRATFFSSADPKITGVGGTFIFVASDD